MTPEEKADEAKKLIAEEKKRREAQKIQEREARKAARRERMIKEGLERQRLKQQEKSQGCDGWGDLGNRSFVTLRQNFGLIKWVCRRSYSAAVTGCL